MIRGARAWAWWLGLLGAVAGARELDPAACASRFDVQRDKIIRTEESREMGARYLSELDVGARQECLRLCCETDACDVFVYEEKGPGSCYLFNCGPPEDFRCKFTAHSNFSSGVLALSRRLAELQDQERLAHHEQELANLRSASVTSTTPSTTAATAPPARPTPPAPTSPRAPHSLEPHQLPAGRCSRYQFECRRGGECIAVYNACDGIPQCADGSDEAPELGCPPPPVPRPAPSTPAAPRPPLQPLQESVELAAANDMLVAESPTLGEHWPHRLAQAQPQHRYNEVGPSSHIFSHKGGLLQEAEGGAQYPPFEPPWPRRWPQQQTGAGMDSLSGDRGWASGGGGGYSRLDWPEPDPRRAWPVPQPRPEPEAPVYVPPKTMPEIPMVYSSQQQTLRDSAKKGFELSAPPPSPAPAPAPRGSTPHLENTTKTKVPKDMSPETSNGPGEAAAATQAERKGATAAQRHRAPDRDDHDHHHELAERDDHDGLSEHPPAAVLLLVLGVLMTTVMATMLGCRARAARRRLRRGKSPFAHDADYLVNGMYL